jgi:hypothetical protein
MYKFGTVKNNQEMVNKETKPLAIYLKQWYNLFFFVME